MTPDFTAEETALAARMVLVLREIRDLDTAINVVAFVAKTVCEPDARRMVYPEMRKMYPTALSPEAET